MPGSTAPRAPRKTPRKKAAAATTRAFLFSDLRDYTKFVETKGDAAAAALLKDYRTLVRREVARHDGAEVKTEGDSFYVVFDAASAALDCAVAILRAVEGRNAKEVTPLRVGVGLHAGETVAYDDQFVGSAVNIASRLAGKAGAGELVISDTLRGLVRTSRDYGMTDRGPQRLKGVDERLRAWSIDWRERPAPVAETAPDVSPSSRTASPVQAVIPSGPAVGQLVCPVVIGRDAERLRMEELLNAVAGGRGHGVLIAGEAGVGKSAFLRDIQRASQERGFRILYGATLESDVGVPYAPFVTAVRSGFRGLERDRLGRFLVQAAPDLAQLFPELGRARSAAATGGEEQHRLALAFHGLLATFAREQPVLLVIEDLHWADEASLALLRYLARELRDARVLLVATYRSDEMHRRHPFLRTLADLQRERLVSEIALRRLTADEVAQLIHATFKLRNPVSPEFRDAIYARSEGNPFFTEELLKALVESGDVYRTETGWGRKDIAALKIPGSIREAVRARIERLSSDAQATLSVAAVIGLRSSFEVLRAARELKESELLGHLKEFIELQLVVEIAGDEDAYGFRHALTREVVYDDLLVRERRALHRTVADVLEKQRAIEPSLVAHHLLAAGESERALPHLLEAAARAEAADAPREAAAHYERAIEIGIADAELPTVLERLAEAYHSFDALRSGKAAEECAALYRKRGDLLGASRMLRLASRSWWSRAEGARAARAAEDAIDVLRDAPESAELGRALSHRAGLRMFDGDNAEAIRLADRAIAIGERVEDQWTIADALVTKGSASRDDPARSLELVLRGRDVAIEHGLWGVAARGYNNASLSVMVLRGDTAEALTLLDEGIAFSRRHGIEDVASLVGLRAMWYFRHDDWDQALANARDVDSHSASHEVALMVDGAVTLAREGPAAALPTFLSMAELGLRAGERQRFAPAVAWAAACSALAGDVAASRQWLGRLRDRVTAPGERGLAALGAAGASLLVAVVLLDDRWWLDHVEAQPTHNEFEVVSRRLWSAARAVLDDDGPGCAAILDEVRDRGRALDWKQHVVVTPVLLRELRRRGVSIGAEFAGVIAEARSRAERVRANWILAELDAIERA